jgi:tRNA pseudouridine synthase 10
MDALSGQLAEFKLGISGFAREFRFHSFWIAVVLPSALEERLGEAEAGALKSRIKRELGMALERKWARRGIRAAHDSPDVLFTLDFHSRRLKPRVKPVFVYGRYRKLSREIPQSKWPCARCRGEGCRRCGGKGAMYPETVEGFIGSALAGLAGATATKMHAVGREDVDARMLGTGRPFVLELENPKRREPDLRKALALANRAAAGKASFSRLSRATAETAALVKSAQPDKTYRVRVDCAAPVSDAMLGKALSLSGRRIAQRTPRRVLHRRADLERERSVRCVRVGRISPSAFTLEARVQSGTYVKELVSGDGGRTRPSLSSLLRAECSPSLLDVLAVHWRLPRG